MSADTTYHFRVLAAGPGGSSAGEDHLLRTLPEAPTVVTGAASALSQTAATLNGTVNANGGTVSDCELEYGTSVYYGSTAPCASSPGSGRTAAAVSASVGGLAPGTTYYFRVLATSPGGTSYGADQALTTQAPSPSPSPPPELSHGVLSVTVRKAPPVPDAELASTSLLASTAGTITIQVTCPGAESRCAGTVTIRTLSAVAVGSVGRGSGKGRAAIQTLASGPFTVAGGHVRTVKLRLTAGARALLRRSHTLRARATIVAHDPAGAGHTAQSTVTIRAATAAHGKG